jgi:transmembrane sensor
MLNQKLVGLFRRYMDKTASPAEKTELFQLLAHSSEEDIKELVGEAWDEFTPAQSPFAATQSDAILQNILGTQAVISTFKKPSRNRWLAAAVTTGIVLLAGGIWLFNGPKTTTPPIITKSHLTNDIAPGGHKAILTLADGKQITLDSNHNGTLAQQGNVRIIKLHNGELAYKSGGNDSQGEIHYNTLTTPKGGQYQIQLPDGTRVWLNAASSLKYPTAFTGNQRNVTLTGEGYFEVAQNAAAPFTVNAGNGVVQVLGTHFNINAYTDEKAMRTTLLEGAVKVTQAAGQVTLTPGQQAQMNDGGQLNVKTVDTEDVIAWKNEQFAFTNMDIPTVMRQVSRWYNVEIAFAGKTPTGEINGKISRNYNISQVLKMLEYTAGIKYSVEGQQVTIY